MFIQCNVPFGFDKYTRCANKFSNADTTKEVKFDSEMRFGSLGSNLMMTKKEKSETVIF
jgi:hypothetical protein